MRRQVDSVNTQCGIALDALSIVYMSVLIVNMKYKQKRELLNRQYFRINFLICIFLALDIAYLGLYGTAGPDCPDLLKIIKSLYFIVNTAIVWAWARYIDLILFASRRRRGKHTILYTAVFFGNTALVLINFFTGTWFGISSGGTFLVRPAAMWVLHPPELFKYSSRLRRIDKKQKEAGAQKLLYAADLPAAAALRRDYTDFLQAVLSHLYVCRFGIDYFSDFTDSNDPYG